MKRHKLNEMIKRELLERIKEKYEENKEDIAEILGDSIEELKGYYINASLGEIDSFNREGEIVYKDYIVTDQRTGETIAMFKKKMHADDLAGSFEKLDTGERELTEEEAFEIWGEI